MIGFHIDMNVAQFRGDYLRGWLKRLSELGYDTIIWELENNIRWNTCPECSSEDAFTVEEFVEILDFSRSLNLEPIPLFQTFGHCEYVLKHNKYAHLAEVPGCIEQYCPSNPDVIRFLHKWIEEYINIFGNIRYFHLGCDEARFLGKCPDCAEYVSVNSVENLYIKHINEVALPVLKKNIRPILWADMLLSYPSSISLLSKEFVLFDWMYDIHRGNGKVWLWGTGHVTNQTIPEGAKTFFAKYLFPNGETDESAIETFYTVDFLADKGFDVVTCPSSSSYGDNVFSPRNRYHIDNTFDSCSKGLNFFGCVLTSWTVHIFPWELQLACIEMLPYLANNQVANADEYLKEFSRKYFGDAGDDFLTGCEFLSKNVLFSYTDSVGISKSSAPIARDHIKKRIADIVRENNLEKELINTQKRLAEYQQSLLIFSSLEDEVAPKSADILGIWKLSAENLINRAKATSLLLEFYMDNSVDISMRIEQVLEEMKILRAKTNALYQQIMKPSRCNAIIGWLFDGVENELKSIFEIRLDKVYKNGKK